MSRDATEPKQRHHVVGWLLVTALVAISVVPMITRRGIFLDGMVYATISRNLAVGIGDPLHPVYTGTINHFREHPPLAFWLESLAFRLCGDHWCVEKIYSLTVSLLTAGMICVLWRRLTRADRRISAYAWLPVIFWVLLPCWQWTAVNNLLENTLSIFATAAVYCMLRAVESDRRWLAWTAAAALNVLLAFLTKGVVGFFPLVAPLAVGLAFGARARNVVWIQALLLGFVAVGLGAILLNPDARDYFFAYFEHQVVASLAGQRETHPSIIGRAHILWEVIFTLSFDSAFVIAVRYWARRQAGAIQRQVSFKQGAWLMLMLGLAASCPVAISPKQTNFYITPSYPFYVLALALGCVESLIALRGAQSPGVIARLDRWVGYASILLIPGAIVFAWPTIGAPRRDWQALEIVDKIATVAPDGTTIDVPEDVARQWALLGYLYRDHYITLAPQNAHREFRLQRKDASLPPADYHELDIDLPGYRLLRR